MNRIDVQEFSREDLQKAMAVLRRTHCSFADINERIIHRLNNPRHEAGFTLPGESGPIGSFKEEVSLFAGWRDIEKQRFAVKYCFFDDTTKVGIMSFEMDLEDLAEIMVTKRRVQEFGPPMNL